MPRKAKAKSKLRIRQKLGKYRLEKRLGETEFAQVFQAADTVMGIPVALKVIRRKHVSRNLLRRFRAESASLNQAEHTGILSVRDASLIDDRLVLSLPLGLENLQSRLERRLSPTTSLLLIDQLLQTTAYAHRRRIIHGGLRPENVLLFADGSARIADFGVSRLANCDGVSSKMDARSDVLALGQLFYRMLSGLWPEADAAWPFGGHQKLQTRVPESTMNWLRKATEPRASRRYQNAAQMLNAFTRIRTATQRFVKRQQANPRTLKMPTRLRTPLRRAA